MSSPFRPFHALSAKRNAAYVQHLIDGIQNRDSNAFAAFYALTADQIYRDFYRALGSAYLVQDCVAKLYVLFVQDAGQIHTPAEAAAALHHIEMRIFQYVTAPDRPAPRRDKRPRPRLSGEEAEVMLIDLLDRLRLPENTVPLAWLDAYDVYLKQKAAAFRWLIVFAVVLLVMGPLLFLNPKGTLTKADSVSPFTGQPAYTLTVNAALPVRSVTASINGHSVPIMQEGRHTYTLLPTASGRLTVTVRTLGRGVRTLHTEVDTAD